MKGEIIRSPFFYVGDKYKLIPQLKRLLPKKISMYVEPFVGGGSSLLNADAETFWANDVDKNVIGLHKYVSSYAQRPNDLFEALWEAIKKYGLSCSYHGTEVPYSLKKKYPKTYYSQFNKAGYLQMRDDFNADQGNYTLLYLLLIYGFNHMIRYNAAGQFNLPVGNVDFNLNVYSALTNYLVFMRKHTVNWFESDYSVFYDQIRVDPDSYVYCDPPYLISSSEYNKLWNAAKETDFYAFLDQLDERGIRFGVTNLALHKGQVNMIFKKWSEKYIVYGLKSNYISFNDNRVKNDSMEFFVTNCEVGDLAPCSIPNPGREDELFDSSDF